MEQEMLLNAAHLTVRYPGESAPILRDVSITLRPAVITCVIGESGCGKSTLFNAILQLPGRVDIMDGSVTYRGRDLCSMTRRELRSVRGSGIGVVFQEPGASLDPIRKISVQFYEALRAHDSKVTREASYKKASEILRNMEFQDPGRILSSCPAQLSGGMNQRVAIALAMAPEPDILLADEPTSALDVTVQAQIAEELLNLRDRYGTCILLITHNMGLVAKMADQVAVMYGGRIIEYGPRDALLREPAHPYTRALLRAIPRLDGKPPTGIPGRKPDVFPAEGCAFATRCPFAKEDCARKPMEPHVIRDGHWSMCVDAAAETMSGTAAGASGDLSEAEEGGAL